MIFGLPKMSKELETLKPYGYHVKNALSLVQNDNNTDSVVYTSKSFQPYAESFSNHYAFVGPSVFSKALPRKTKDRPLIYISMGTIINDRPDFYGKCIDALKDLHVDVIISFWHNMQQKIPGKLPDNIKSYPYVDQLDVLSKANAFITHCGMNSVSDSLYMATPMILYPQTNEQCAVAKRVTDMKAGILLQKDSSSDIRSAVEKILGNDSFAENAKKCSEDFRSCPGTAGAAEFIENAPHPSEGRDIIEEMNKQHGKTQLLYWLIAATVIILFGSLLSWRFVWIIGVAAGVLSYPIGKAMQKRTYKKIVEKTI